VGVFCLDFDGRLVWSKATRPYAMQFDAGTAASPVLHGDRIYLVNDTEERSHLLALDKRTGKKVWRVDRDEKSNWCTPYVWEHGKRVEIITSGSNKVRAYELDGKLVWWFTGMSGITIPTPFAEQGLLYVCSGYIRDKRRPVYAIRPGAIGDISLQPGQTGNTAIAWCRPMAAPYHPTPLLYAGRLFLLNDRGWLSAFDPQTGAPLFEKKRFPGRGQFWASPWAQNGYVFCLNEDGVTYVVQGAGDRFELLHTNKLDNDDMCFATPAIANDRLLIRTSARIYCIEGPRCRQGSEEVNRDDES
jgi:outer membrane protein assembly factor BamB